MKRRKRNGNPWSIYLSFFKKKYCRHSMCCCQMITTADSNIQTNWKEINIRHSERKVWYYQYHHHQIPWFFEIISLLFESLVASEKKTNIRFHFNSSWFSSSSSYFNTTQSTKRKDLQNTPFAYHHHHHHFQFFESKQTLCLVHLKYKFSSIMDKNHYINRVREREK